MARGYAGAFGGKKINNTVGLARVLRRLPDRARRLAPAALAAEPRPARAALLLGLALVLQPRRHLHERAARLSAALVPPRPDDLDRLAGRRAARRGPSGRSGCSLAATVFLLGFRDRAQRGGASNVIDVGYSGVDRRPADRPAGSRRTGTCRSRTTSSRAGRRTPSGEIRERIQTNGRCESANERGDTYGPVAYEAYLPAVLASSAGAASGTACPRRTRPRSSSTSSASSGSRSSGCASAGRGSRRRSRSRGPPTRSRSTCSSSNTNDAIMPAFLIWGFWLVTLAVGARRLLRARGLDEVRRAARRAALALVSGGLKRPREQVIVPRSASPPRRSPRSRSCFLEPNPLHARARLLGPHARLADRARVAVLDLGLAPVPRRGHPEPALASSGCSRSLLVVGAFAVYFVPEAQDAAPARRADGRAAARLRARADALVLPLHPVVLPLRRVRAARAPARAGRDRGRCRAS